MSIRQFLAAIALAGGSSIVLAHSDGVFRPYLAELNEQLADYAPTPAPTEAHRSSARRAFWQLGAQGGDGGPATTQARGVPGLRACWTPDELAGAPQEWKIRQGGEEVRRPPLGPSRSAAREKELLVAGIVRRVAIPGEAKLVALTFDLGERPDETAGYDGRIVDYLRQEEVKATFFAGGKWMLSHELRASQLLADPLFEIGNHGWINRNLSRISHEQVRADVEATQFAYGKLREAFGAMACAAPPVLASAEGGALPPRPAESPGLFRFPYGACDSDALKAVGDAGLITVQWDVSSGDNSRTQTAETLADRVRSSLRPGSILRFHADGRGRETAEALRTLIPWMKAEGWRFLTVSELIAFPGAEPETAASCYDRKPGDTARLDDDGRRRPPPRKPARPAVKRELPYSGGSSVYW